MPEEIPPVRGQAGRLEQVVLNLVVNAMQAIEEHAAQGEVAVRVSCDATHVRISVEDTGPGFPAGVADKIFDRFFTTKPVGKGTGLGLWIAKQIMTEHGGTIAASNRDGGGARMVIALPRCDVAESGTRSAERGARADSALFAERAMS